MYQVRCIVLDTHAFTLVSQQSEQASGGNPKREVSFKSLVLHCPLVAVSVSARMSSGVSVCSWYGELIMRLQPRYFERQLMPSRSACDDILVNKERQVATHPTLLLCRLHSHMMSASGCACASQSPCYAQQPSPGSGYTCTLGPLLQSTMKEQEEQAGSNAQR